MNILFYKKKFNLNFSIYDRLEMDRIYDILPQGVQVNFSCNPIDLQTADVVIWDIPFLWREYTTLKKPCHQIWVGWLMESTVIYPWIKQVIGLFDLTMTYSLDSDVPIPYFYYSYIHGMKTMPVKKTQEIACFIGSRVNLSHRLEYLNFLMQRLNIDTYGYKKNTLIKNRHYQTKQEVSRQYKFILAFENAIEKEWITEKFFDPLLVGSVPVYLGAPDIEEYAPGNNCFINANTMSPPELADVLIEYLNDENLYDQLFEWKKKPLTPKFLAKIELVKKHFILRLLDKLKDKEWGS